MKENMAANQSELDGLDELVQLKLKRPEFRKRWKYLDGEYQLAKLIIQHRVDLHMSRKDLASKAKTTLSVITRIESLSVSVTFRMASRIASALGKTLQISFI